MTYVLVSIFFLGDDAYSSRTVLVSDFLCHGGSYESYARSTWLLLILSMDRAGGFVLPCFARFASPSTARRELIVCLAEGWVFFIPWL
jgi:hypothetical protein